MGRYLQAFKEEGRALIGKRQEALPPPAQPYYDDHTRPPPYSYGAPASSELSPEQLQMIIAHAKLQGAREEIEKSRAELHAAHHAGADRIQALALAAINKENQPFEIRYHGSAADKKERRFAELKFAAACILLILALIAIWSVKDNWNASPDWGSTAAAPMNSPHRPAHYKRSEEWDDR